MDWKAVDLTVEYRKRPMGIDDAAPRLSWKLFSERRGSRQTAYRIQVCQENDFQGELIWDSGRQESSSSAHIPYGGAGLRPRTSYFFRVKAWNERGEESDWSAPGGWETGKLGESWTADWITADAGQIRADAQECFLLRSGFAVHGKLASARAYASAAGLYELYLNGSRVGDELLAPGWTSYGKRLQYQTYDVTAYLQEGHNAAGLMLGDGWYRSGLAWEKDRFRYGDRRAALMEIHLQYEDGRSQLVVTDGSWAASTGPVLSSSIYNGEQYDARLEQPGWNSAGFSGGGQWSPAEVLQLPMEPLVAQENDPLRVLGVLRPAAILRTPDGGTVLDMGQNMVGRMRLSVSAPAGTEITLRHAEVLDAEGNIYFGSLRSARQEVLYVASGDGLETYAPYFTFQGFRYVQVSGYPGDPDSWPEDAFVGEVIHTDMAPAGSFECSHSLLNQLQSNILWGQRGNFVDVPTDCPQRDERLGWTGDAQVFIPTALFNYQGGSFFTKWLRDLRSDQRPDGGVPHVIPSVIEGDSSAGWADAATICPWALYRTYGDKRILEEQYASMKAWVDYIARQGEEETLWNTGFHFGDWLALDAPENSYIGATPRDLIATAYYAHSTRLLREVATVLGHEEGCPEVWRAS